MNHMKKMKHIYLMANCGSVADHDNDADADAKTDADEIKPDGQLDCICGAVAYSREKEAIAHSNKA